MCYYANNLFWLKMYLRTRPKFYYKKYIILKYVPCIIAQIMYANSHKTINIAYFYLSIFKMDYCLFYFYGKLIFRIPHDGNIIDTMSVSCMAIHICKIKSLQLNILLRNFQMNHCLNKCMTYYFSHSYMFSCFNSLISYKPNNTNK